jgi:hypothetical protein
VVQTMVQREGERLKICESELYALFPTGSSAYGLVFTCDILIAKIGRVIVS